MGGLFRSVRAGEHRDTAAASVLLFCVVTAHALLETARDALFLSSVPATRLPVVYVAIAVSIVVLLRGQARWIGRDRRRTLQVFLAAASAVTAGFWLALPLLGTAGLYALYVWSGVMATSVLVTFWVMLGGIFSMAQAKRLFPMIGVGGAAGAILGSAAAAGLMQVADAPALLLAAAGAIVVAAFASGYLPGTPAISTTRMDGSGGPAASVWAQLRLIVTRPYPRHVAVLAFVTAATVTMVDFLFKHLVSTALTPEELGPFLANLYLVLNLASLGSQVFLAGWITRRLGVVGAGAALPALLLAGGIGVVAVGGLAAATALRSVDGTARHSVHKTATELLFVPMSVSVRAAVKPFVDVVAQRGGQVVGSVLIGLIATLGADERVFAAMVVALAAVWLGLVIALRQPYLEVFRKQLRYGQTAIPTFPELDVGNLETLLAALDSADDGRVIGALELLDAQERLSAVPSFILHHPSERVVLKVLELFTKRRRVAAVEVLRRLGDHRSAAVRATALGAISVLEPDAPELEEQFRDADDPVFRAAIGVHLIASGALPRAEQPALVAQMLAEGGAAARIAFADAVRFRSAAGFEDALLTLAEDADVQVRAAAARAMAGGADPRLLGVLFSLLQAEVTREPAMAALRTFGGQAYDFAAAALVDEDTPRPTRWQLPRALAALDPARAAPLLLGHLPEEPDGMVRYRIIRALQTLVRDAPSIELDADHLQRAIRGAIRRAYRSVERMLVLDAGAAEAPERSTPGHALLRAIVQSKLDNAMERLLRLLGQLHPSEDFRRIHLGLKSDAPAAFASALELLEHTLQPALLPPVLGLVQDLEPAERLERAGDFREPIPHDYTELLSSLLSDRSLTMRGAAIYHIGELRLTRLEAQVAGASGHPDLVGDVRRTLGLLEAARDG